MAKKTPFKSSWEFFTEAVFFLKKNAVLLVFPLLSFLSIAIMYSVYVSYSAYHFDRLVDFYQNDTALLIISLIILYFVISFIFLFFNAAFVSCVLQRMQGGKGQIGQSLLLTSKKLGPLLGWSLFSATVGLFLSTLGRSHKGLANMLHALLGFSWAITTAFVLPVMMAQNLGPITAFKHSIRLVGRSFRALFSVDLIFIFIFFGTIAIFKAILYFRPDLLPIASIIIIALIVVWIVFIKMANSIFNCALYLDLQGQVVQGLKQEIITSLKNQEK